MCTKYQTIFKMHVCEDAYKILLQINDILLFMCLLRLLFTTLKMIKNAGGIN